MRFSLVFYPAPSRNIRLSSTLPEFSVFTLGTIPYFTAESKLKILFASKPMLRNYSRLFADYPSFCPLPLYCRLARAVNHRAGQTPHDLQLQNCIDQCGRAGSPVASHSIRYWHRKVLDALVPSEKGEFITEAAKFVEAFCAIDDLSDNYWMDQFVRQVCGMVSGHLGLWDSRR
jgi:hypothetical protein